MIEVRTGDCRTVLAGMAEGSVQMCATLSGVARLSFAVRIPSDARRLACRCLAFLFVTGAVMSQMASASDKGQVANVVVRSVGIDMMNQETLGDWSRMRFPDDLGLFAPDIRLGNLYKIPCIIAALARSQLHRPHGQVAARAITWPELCGWGKALSWLDFPCRVQPYGESFVPGLVAWLESSIILRHRSTSIRNPYIIAHSMRAVKCRCNGVGIEMSPEYAGMAERNMAAPVTRELFQ